MIFRPERLHMHDTLGICAPAGPILPSSSLSEVARFIKHLGFNVEPAPNTNAPPYGYLSGPDSERIADLMHLFFSSEIRGIIAAKGGYGSIRLLDSIDFEAVRKNHKIFVGFSDVTTLLLAIYSQTHSVVFHGPMPLFNFHGTTDAEHNSRLLFDMLNGSATSLRIDLSQFGVYSATRGDRVSGILVGGNLSALTFLAGTRYMPDLSDAILFIEDIDEEPYSIDRLLTRLRLSHALDRVRAILVGEFVNCVPTNPTKPSFTAKEVILERLSPYQVPVVFTNSFGHGAHMVTFPIGIEATLNADSGILTLAQSPVL